jgi:hypothetical protein
MNTEPRPLDESFREIIDEIMAPGLSSVTLTRDELSTALGMVVERVVAIAITVAMLDGGQGSEEVDAELQPCIDGRAKDCTGIASAFAGRCGPCDLILSEAEELTNDKRHLGWWP